MRLVLTEQRHRLLSIRHRGHDAHIRLGIDGRGGSGTDHRVIVGDQNLNRLHRHPRFFPLRIEGTTVSIVVPWPGVLTSFNSPSISLARSCMFRNPQCPLRRETASTSNPLPLSDTRRV